MSSLTNKDYINILTFYKINLPKTKLETKRLAEDILASKLCRCIKRIDVVNESKSIGICTKTIFNNKGFTRGKFKCKSKMYVNFKKTRKVKRSKGKKQKK